MKLHYATLSCEYFTHSNLTILSFNVMECLPNEEQLLDMFLILGVSEHSAEWYEYPKDATVPCTNFNRYKVTWSLKSFVDYSCQLFINMFNMYDMTHIVAEAHSWERVLDFTYVLATRNWPEPSASSNIIFLLIMG